MNKENYNKMKVKNLRYNIMLFGLASTITIHTISSAIKVNAEPTKPIELENMIPSPTEEITETLNEIEEEMILTVINSKTDNYSGMKLSNEYEDEIKRLTSLYNIPYQIVLTIGYRESAGNWNNNGVISSTNDYGMFQINECNLAYIEEKLGFTKDEILNDPVKNAEVCIYLLKDIIKREDVTTVEEVFGMYNGWVGWENKPLAVNYSSACCEIINEYFPEFEYTKTEKQSNF